MKNKEFVFGHTLRCLTKYSTTGEEGCFLLFYDLNCNDIRAQMEKYLNVALFSLSEPETDDLGRVFKK